MTTYDSGTLTVTVDGFQASAPYNQNLNNTPTALATALANALNVPNSPVTATPSGASITLIAKGVGTASNYSVTGSSTASFTVSGTTLGNSTNPGGLYTPYVTNYSYNTLDDLIQVNQLGDGSQAARVRTFTYDSLKQLLTALNPESGIITYSYDANSNMVQKQSPAPNAAAGSTATQIITYCYDQLNRITGRGYGSQSCPLTSPAATYTYDAGTNGVGHLTAVTDAAGGASYIYDPLGRMSGETRTIAGISKSMSYGYYLDSSIQTLTYPSGATVTYTPNSNGSVTAGRTGLVQDSGNNINYVTGSGGPTAFASHEPDGSVTASVSGYTSAFAGVTNSFSYNQRLQPVTMSAASASGTVFSLTYDFHLGAGDNGNVWAITNNKDASRNQTFGYDQVNRLISAQNAGTDCSKSTVNGKTEYWGNNYGYDAWGNLLSKVITKCGGENLSLTAASNNQLQGGYAYDAAGNMTHDATANLNYTFDQENRITGAGGYAYTYDADGNRVEKSNGSAGTLYWYMSPGIVAESDLTGNLQSEYVFFNGERVARRDNPTGTNSTVAYYFSDHLNTTDIVTDAVGNIKNESDFYPWGGELQFLANDSNHYKFTGKERDTETGLDYFGARYYSNGMGRFITPDWAATPEPVPYADLTDPQSLNQYSYVRNIPTVRVDPDGHCCWDEIKTFLVGAAKEVHNWGADMASRGISPLGLPARYGTFPVVAAIGESTGLTGMGPGPGGLGNAEPVIETPSNGLETAGMVTTRYAPVVLAVVGAKAGVGEEPVGNASRLPQDINVNPRAPAANNGNGAVGPSPTQNAAAQADAAAARAAGHTDIRTNQQQVNAQGQRVGVNRPDLQSTDANGVRHYTEYDRSAQNAADHHVRTQANDPNGVTHTNVGP